MKIKGFIKNTFIEYPGKIAAMVFLPGCNFRCSFCFNPQLIFESDEMPDVDEKEVFGFLEKQRKWIDAIVVSGGEPTLQKDLPDFIEKIKKMDLLVRIYTNGTNPDMLKLLIKKKMIDSVAMDIKAPLTEEGYEKITNTRGFLDNVKESISLIMDSGLDCEFRTTVVPSLHSDEDIIEIVKFIKDAKSFVLQRFLPENVLDNKLKKLKPQSDEEMERLVDIAKKHVKNTKWR